MAGGDIDRRHGDVNKESFYMIQSSVLGAVGAVVVSVLRKGG